MMHYACINECGNVVCIGGCVCGYIEIYVCMALCFRWEFINFLCNFVVLDMGSGMGG